MGGEPPREGCATDDLSRLCGIVAAPVGVRGSGFAVLAAARCHWAQLRRQESYASSDGARRTAAGPRRATT